MPADCDAFTVDWTSSNISVATVSNNGLVSIKQVGETTVTAKVRGLDVSDSFAFRVEAPPVSVSLITINKPENNTLNLKEGTYTFSVTSEPDNALAFTLNWFSGDESVATISDSGVLTMLKSGTTKIRAEVDGKETIFDEFDLIIEEDEVEINYKKYHLLSLPYGNTNPSNQDGSFTSNITSGEGFPQVRSIQIPEDADLSGLTKLTIVYKGTLNCGPAYIRANSAIGEHEEYSFTFNGEKQTATIDLSGNVQRAGENLIIAVARTDIAGTLTIYDAFLHGAETGVWITNSAIAYNPTRTAEYNDTLGELLLKDGGTRVLSYGYFGDPTDLESATAVWESSDPEVASIDETTGVLTYIKEGETTIKLTVTLADESVFVDQVNINLIESTSKITGITITNGNKPAGTLYPNTASFKLGVATTPASAEAYLATWESTDLDVATVDGSGNVIIVGPGETTIKVTARGISATHIIAVAHPTITITNKISKISLGDDTYKVNLIQVGFVEGTEVLYSSENEAAATIDETGRITAVAEGTTKITVTRYNGETSYSDHFNLTVVSEVLQILNKRADPYHIDDTLVLEAEIRDNSGPILGETISWESDNDEIAEVATDGTVTFNDSGEVTITASATLDGNTVSDEYTFIVFKSLNKLNVSGLEYGNSGSVSNLDGSFTYSASGAAGQKAIQAFGTGTETPAAKLVDDFCKAAFSKPEGKLFVTVTFAMSTNIGSLFLRERSGNVDVALANYQAGKRTVTVELTESWKNCGFTTGVAFMLEHNGTAGTFTMYDAFFHTEENIIGEDAKDGIWIENSALFLSTASSGNLKDTFAKLLGKNGGKRQLAVGSFADFDAKGNLPIWFSSNTNAIIIDKLTGEMTFIAKGASSITVIYNIDGVVYGDRVLIDTTVIS